MRASTFLANVDLPALPAVQTGGQVHTHAKMEKSIGRASDCTDAAVGIR